MKQWYYEYDYDKKSAGMEFIKHTTHGDYIGATVEKANYNTVRTWLSRCRGVYDVYGAYGFTCIGYIPKECTRKTRDRIKKIEDKLYCYPILDEEELSKIEMELMDESFAEFVAEYYRKHEDEIGIPEEKYRETIMISDIARYYEEHAIIETGCLVYIDERNTGIVIDMIKEMIDGNVRHSTTSAKQTGSEIDSAKENTENQQKTEEST